MSREAVVAAAARRERREIDRAAAEPQNGREVAMTGKSVRRGTAGRAPAFAFAAAIGVAAGWAPAAGAVEALVNDYPTVARADYVFGCMAANGETRQALERCSCSIDVIASILSYDHYVEAETIMSISRTGGEKTSMFKSSPQMRNKVADLRRAQAEAEVRCF